MSEVRCAAVNLYTLTTDRLQPWIVSKTMREFILMVLSIHSRVDALDRLLYFMCK